MLKKQDASVILRSMKEVLEPLKNDEVALGMKAYMKDHFEFLGIRADARRTACKLHVRELFPSIKDISFELWNEGFREYHYVACDILTHQKRKLHDEDLNWLKKLVMKHSWWDTVDQLAPVIGDLVLQSKKNGNSENVMDKWLLDKNMWVRRVAMIHQLKWKLETDETRLFRYALHLAPEKEFFIRKAIGWALREYAKKKPDAVRGFLTKHKTELSGLSFREASKHM